MSAPPYMRLYWGDYSRKTRHLKRAAEHGAYLMLIGALWDGGGKLPADDDTLASHAMLTPKEWASMKAKIMPFFKVSRGFLTQARVTEELAKYRDTSGKRKQAGKAGGRASRGKDGGNGEANALQMPTQSESKSEEETPLPPKGAARRKPEVALPADCPSAELVAAMQAEAREAGANLDVGFEARQFRDWWTAKDGRNRDWDACWRTWARRAIGRAPKTAVAALSARQPGSDDDLWRRRIREFKSNRYWPTDDAGPRPGAPGCQVPPAILAEFGFSPAQPANDPKPDLFEGAAA